MLAQRETYQVYQGGREVRRRAYDCAICPGSMRASRRCGKPLDGVTYYTGPESSTCAVRRVESQPWVGFAVLAWAWEARVEDMDIHTAESVMELRRLHRQHDEAR